MSLYQLEKNGGEGNSRDAMAVRVFEGVYPSRLTESSSLSEDWSLPCSSFASEGVATRAAASSTDAAVEMNLEAMSGGMGKEAYTPGRR